MSSEIGVWIDHREAVIVSLSGEHEELKRLASNMEKHVRYGGAAEQDSAEDQRDRRFTGHLNKYYDEVVALVRDAESILVMGPGEAKGELVERLEREQLRERVVGVLAADKMTEGQVAARVREYYRNSERKLPCAVALP